MTRPYHELTPAEQTEVDRRYELNKARTVISRVTPRIARLTKISEWLHAELRRMDDTDLHAAESVERARSYLLEALRSDARRLDQALRMIEPVEKK